MGVAELNRVKYSGLDFDAHFDDLQARMQIKFASDFNDFATSSLGIMLIDIIAFGLDSLSFYLDRRATDMYLETARSRKSVARLTRQIGYKMRASIAASVDLDVSITNPKVVTVPIPEGFKFQGPNDLVFEAAQEVSWTPSEQVAGIVKQVPCYQGETFTDNFVSDGTPNQVFELRRTPDSNYVVSGTVTVLVDGSSWDEEEFLAFEATDHFEVGYNDEPTTVRFGDGVAGNIPTVGASIVVTYVASRGKEGIVNKDTIQDVVNPLVVAFDTVTLSINNAVGSSGGDDPEDLVHAKIFAGLVYKSRFVAVTRNDYEALAGSFASPLFGRVAVAQAVSSRSADTDLLLQSLLSDINAVIDPIKPAVDASVDNSVTILDAVDVLLANMATTLESIATAATDIDTDTDSIVTSARANKNLAIEVDASTSIIQTNASNGKAAIDAITTGADALTTLTKDALKEFFTLIESQNASISGNAGTVESDAATILAKAGSIIDNAALVGLTVADVDSLLLSAETDRTNAQTQLGATGLRAELDDISAAVLVLDSGVDTALSAIHTHVDKILAADCKANLVSVPILTRDAGGFYAAPSLSLIAALQDYLDARKEVTQTVEVLSGVDFLIPAVITARIGVRSGFSESITESEVNTAINGILRDRRFGVSLYESDLHDAILLVPGVSFANVDIQGFLDPTTSTLSTVRTDASGNLILLTSEVITKGTVTINTEPAKTAQ
jgi:hypothetical protein